MRSQKNTNATPRSPTPEDSPNPPSGGADGHPTPDRIVFAPLFDHENENIDPIAFSPGGTAQVTETEFVSAVLRAVDAVSGLRKNPNISSSKILLPSDLDPAYYSQHARPFWTVIRGNPVGIFVNCSQAEAAARDDTSSSIAGCLTWHGARKFYKDAFDANAIRLDPKPRLGGNTNNAGPSRRLAPFPAPSPLHNPSPETASKSAITGSGTKKHPITVPSTFPTPVLHYARRVVNQYPGRRVVQQPPTPTPAPKQGTRDPPPAIAIAVVPGTAPVPGPAASTSAAFAAPSTSNTGHSGTAGSGVFTATEPATAPRGVKRLRACKKYVLYEFDVSAEAGGHPELDEGHPLPLVFYAKEPLFTSTFVRSPTISSIGTSTLDNSSLLNLTPTTNDFSSPDIPLALQAGPSRAMSAPPPRVPPLLPPFAIASAARPFESIDELNEHPAKRTKKTPLHTLSTPKRAPKKGKVDSKAKTKAKAKAKTPDLDSSDLFESDEAPPPKTDKGKAKVTPSSILDTVEIAELYDSDPVEYVANSSTYDGRD